MVPAQRFLRFLLSRRWKIRINSQIHNILQHIRHKPSQQRTINLNTRIRITLNQPRPKLLINQKIKPKQLKIKLPAVPIKHNIPHPKCLNCQIFHLGQHFGMEVVVAVLGLEVFLELVEGQFVGGLVLAEVLGLGLDCVVG